MLVIPMAGLSQRFARAGYKGPKFKLPLSGGTVFSHAVGSFAKYADRMPFLFIAREEGETESFIRSECETLGLSDIRVVMLDQPTGGQAETVEFGLLRGGVGPEQSITIFNIDTFRPGFRFPDEPWCTRSDGYLEVFEGSGSNWSYVGPRQDSAEPLVARTTEKQPISDLCCVGLYHFARANDFTTALDIERAAPSMPELYVAPLYNHLIAAGRRIHYSTVARRDVVFCGIPEEYQALNGSEAPRTDV